MAKEFRLCRVLQHDTCDQIRIGGTFRTVDIEAAIQDVKEQLDENMKWCGGFEEGCKRFYKRIAIVDAETLAVISNVYVRP